MSLIQRIGDKEREYVLRVLEGQFRKSRTAASTGLEEAFAEAVGVRFAIGFVNGTATMHSALAAMDVGPGDEVIVPPLTMASTALAVIHCQALPVFADIDPDTWNIDPASIEQQIGPRTKAILPVAIYGLPPDMPRIMQIAGEHNLQVLEDDAQCFLGSIDGKICGSIAHASSFSFQASKHITSGEGGIVTTDDPQLAERIRRHSNLGYAAVGADPKEGMITKETIQHPGYKRHTMIGWNYRMSEICAAVALAQVERLEELVGVRLRVAEHFAKALEGCSWLVPQHIPQGYRHCFWTYAFRLDNDDAFSWEEFRQKFVELGGDSPYGTWSLTYLEPAFYSQKFDPRQTQIFRENLCPVAERIQPQLVQLKSNYFDLERAKQQADVLHQTIQFFDRSY